ncbi:hypothetical protein ACVXZ4_16910 [Lacisediminihabitans sp. FW035]
MTPATPPRWITPRRAIVAGLIAAALMLAAAISFSVLPGAALAPVAAPTPSVTTEPVPVSTTGPTNPDSTVAPGAQSSATPPGTTTRTSTEVQAGGTSDSLANPASAAIAPLLSGAAPKTASKNGAIVTGFPATIPVAAGSTIGSSAVASSGNNVQATLVAKTSLAAPDLLDYYQSAFAKIGLYSTEVPAVGGSTAFSFAHGNDTVTLTVTPTKTGADYSIYAVLRATP